MTTVCDDVYDTMAILFSIIIGPKSIMEVSVIVIMTAVSPLVRIICH